MRARVELGRHVIVGAGSIIFPGVIMAEGGSIGSCSMVTKSTDAWTIYFGVPAKRIKSRSKKMLEIEIGYLNAKPSV